jgi:hypothetical protein
MHNYRVENILNDLKTGFLTESEAERKLNRLYPDGCAVEDTVHHAVRDFLSGWSDSRDVTCKIEREYAREESRKRFEEKEARDHRAEEEMRRRRDALVQERERGVTNRRGEGEEL